MENSETLLETWTARASGFRCDAVISGPPTWPVLSIGLGERHQLSVSEEFLRKYPEASYRNDFSIFVEAPWGWFLHNSLVCSSDDEYSDDVGAALCSIVGSQLVKVERNYHLKNVDIFFGNGWTLSVPLDDDEDQLTFLENGESLTLSGKADEKMETK